MFAHFISTIGAREDEHRALLEQLASRGEALRLLESYLAWSRRESRPAGRSHAHNNGFLKISLWRHPETGTSIRVHVWKPARQPSTSSVHNHRWNLSSLVLAGRLSFSNFEQVPAAGGGWFARDLTDADLRGVKQCAQLARCDLRLTCEYTVTPGGTHWIEHTQLHRTPAPSSFAATLVLTGPPRRSFSRVIMRPDPETGGSCDGTTSGRTLEPREVERALREVIERSHAV
jgi:hypothetical protein